MKCFVWTFTLTFYIDQAVRVGPFPALQDIKHSVLRGLQRHLADLFGEKEKATLVKLLTASPLNMLVIKGDTDPLVDCLVLAAVDLVLLVEYPLGRAGVGHAVVEHTVDSDRLPRTDDRHLRDVGLRCTNTHIVIFFPKR